MHLPSIFSVAERWLMKSRVFSAQDVQLRVLDFSRVPSCSENLGIHQQPHFSIQSSCVRSRLTGPGQSSVLCDRAGKRLKTKSVCKIFIFCHPCRQYTPNFLSLAQLWQWSGALLLQVLRTRMSRVSAGNRTASRQG